ncbi:RNA-directed DNA polymerase, eukaryota [Tanacetum coccineum]
MREVVTDYGPSPFRVYQSWFHKKGFDKLIKDSWSYSSSNDSNKIILLKKKLQALKASIKEWCKDDIKRSNDTCLLLSKISASELHNFNKSHSLDLAQKAKVRWAIEGDENSKYFHGIINKKRSQLAIRGSPSGPCIDIDCHLFKKLSSEQVDDLECDVTFDEIKKAIVSKILANRLKMVISELISDVQSAFVSNRQILDGPFILNELISWCKAHKSKAMIFKVDFEKAFDSVRWDFLDIILRNFGFGIKWRGWIQGCLSSAMGSILVNGSPTAEFKFHKGLKQGDPLSPYLFHLGLCKSSLANGIEQTSLPLVYARKCFFLASGLQINILMSNLWALVVSHEEVHMWQSIIIGCSTFSTPFSYLGVKVGMSPSRRKAWDEIIGKFISLELYLERAQFFVRKRSFPRLYALELKKGITVADKLIDASFVASFRRNPRGGVEEEQLHHLVDLVGSISLSPSNDRWAWLLGSSGEFSVHSARTFIDDILLPFVGDFTRWVKSWLPITGPHTILFDITSHKWQAQDFINQNGTIALAVCVGNAQGKTEVNQLHLDRVEQAEPVAIHDQWLKDIFNFCPLNEPASSSSRLSDKCFLTSGLSRMIDLLAKFGYWVIFKIESWVLWSDKGMKVLLARRRLFYSTRTLFFP